MAASPNYFAHATAAERYARGRPYHHPSVVRRIAEVTGRTRFSSALDVGCGTGQSTMAIADIAELVVGIDVSAEMLARAIHLPNASFHLAAAEMLPFADRSFDLVTVGMAFHWLEQSKFLTEARRVLFEDGWLAIYNSGFLGELEEAPDFSRWYRDVYLTRYPWPPRAESGVSEELAGSLGFTFVQRELVTQGIPMSAEEFVRYHLTQSNVIAKVEQATEKVEMVAQFLSEAVAPYFHSGHRTLCWQSTIDFLRPRRLAG
jgi:SAM-dependent methyltransferase